MYCLSRCNKGLFKSYYCYVLFLFLIPFPFILEKNLLVNKYKKQLRYKKNESIFFWRLEKCPTKVCHFQYKHRSLFSIGIGNIRSWQDVKLQKPI